jgi:hypothetical protein
MPGLPDGGLRLNTIDLILVKCFDYGVGGTPPFK